MNKWINSSFDNSSPPPPKKQRPGKQPAPSHINHKKKVGSKIVPWYTKYEPSSKDDLALNKKKLNEIENWIKKNLSSKQQKCPILLLTGPPGSGKTAAIKVLAKHLGLHLQEWANAAPLLDAWDKDLYEDSLTSGSQAALFASYLLRASRYPSLFDNEVMAPILLVVEEFPNNFIREPQLFHDILRNFSTKGRCLLVFILSDSSSAKNPLDQLLFPLSLRNELNFSHITVNPIAPTALVRALKNVISQVSKVNRKLKIPSPDILQQIAESNSGDIRSALNALQFSTGGKSTSLCQKDSTLFLFHALGKILYAKRTEGIAHKLPPGLKHLERAPLASDPEEVYEKTAISAESFTLFLHQNFLDFTSNIEMAANCSTWFTEADLFSSHWTDCQESKLDTLAASICSRGLMFHLKTPRGHSWKPLHKPQWYAIHKQAKSNLASIRAMFPGPILKDHLILTLPFCCKIQRGLELNFLQFSNKAHRAFSLSEKSGYLEEEEDEGEELALAVPPAPLDLLSAIPQESENKLDEELTIEEYPD